MIFGGNTRLRRHHDASIDTAGRSSRCFQSVDYRHAVNPQLDVNASLAPRVRGGARSDRTGLACAAITAVAKDRAGSVAIAPRLASSVAKRDKAYGVR